MCVLIIAGSYAVPVFEPTHAAFHGLARPVACRVVGPGMRAPRPGWKDSLNAPSCSLGAEGVAVIRPDPRSGRTGARRSRPQTEPVGVVVALAARHAQAQGASLRPRAEPVALFGARLPSSRARTTVLSRPTANRSGSAACRPSGAADILIAPVSLAHSPYSAGY